MTFLSIRPRTHQSPRRRRFSIVVMALFLALLSGCSATQLAYRNLDWLISRKVNQIVDLNSGQQAWFDNQLKNTLQWHCEQEIPRYRDELANIRESLLSAELDANAVEADMQRTEASAGRLVAHTAPIISGLLQRLDDDQIHELQTNMDEHLDEQYEEFVSPSADEQQKNSATKASDFLERWLGPLSPQQSALIAQWATTRADSNRIWLDNRRHWQNLLFSELSTRQQNDFQERVRRLLVDYRQLQTPEYAQQAPQSKRAFSQLLAQVMQATTAKQKNHLSAQVDDLLEDLQALDCSTEKKPS